MDSSSATTVREPRIIRVGGGFGGLAAARALRKASARVLLIVGGGPTGVELAGRSRSWRAKHIDKTNHHDFQPLLCQVATSVLSPEHIAPPASNFRSPAGGRCRCYLLA